MANKSLSISGLLTGLLLITQCRWMDDISDWFQNPDRIDRIVEEGADVEAQESDAQAGSPASTIPVSPGGDSSTLRPVVFRNLGSIPYTVSAWTYIPFDASAPAVPSSASTVSSPGGNTSNALTLPQGTYTWCYWWELGDINNDGMMEYAHAIDERPVTLGETDSTDVSSAETVDLAAPAETGLAYGLCGMDISPFVVSHQHADNINGALVNMAHGGDLVVLEGPITVLVWYTHAAQQIGPGVPAELTEPEMVTIPAGETRTFELVEYRDDHPGDWNIYIWLITVDE